MTSSVVPAIAWPTIVIAYVVVGIRLTWFDASAGERRITAVLALAASGCVLRESVVQEAMASISPEYLSVGFTRQLSTTVIVLAMAPFFMVVLSWTLQDREPSWLSSAVYATAASFVPLMLLVGAGARESGQYIDKAEGWRTIAYFAMFAIWVGGMAFVLLKACVSELRRGALAPRHILSYLVIGAIGLWAAEEAASIMTSALFASQGVQEEFVQLRFTMNENNFVLMVGLGAVCAALPACSVVLERFGIDRTTRDIRALQELWTDLTSACPEVRYVPSQDQEPVSSGRRLHRMTIEIRDSILILKHFTSTQPSVDDTALQTAIALRDAAASKSANNAPGHPSAAVKLTPASGSETRALKAIASQWKNAATLVPTYSMTEREINPASSVKGPA